MSSMKPRDFGGTFDWFGQSRRVLIFALFIGSFVQLKGVPYVRFGDQGAYVGLNGTQARGHATGPVVVLRRLEQPVWVHAWQATTDITHQLIRSL